MPQITLYPEAGLPAQTLHQQAVLPGEWRTGRALFAQALHRVSAHAVQLPLEKSAPQRKRFVNHGMERTS